MNVQYKDLIGGALKKIGESRKKLSSDFNNLTRQTFIFAIAGNLIAISALFNSMPIHAADKANEYKTAIKINKESPALLNVDDKKVVIEVGESKFEQAEREKQEQEKAELEKSLQQSKKKVILASNTSKASKPIAQADPSDFRQLYMSAANQFGIPWQLLEAVHQVETGKSGSTAIRSYAGAQGPMQFMPGTWRAYEVDGNGDGKSEINNVTDAVYTAAHYLARSGADEGRVDDALFNYNHSRSYVNTVKSIAYEIGL